MQTSLPPDRSAKSEAQVRVIVLNPENENACNGDELSAVGLLEFLEVDDRPVFVLDLRSLKKAHPVYCNPSLRRIPLLELQIGKNAAAGNIPRDPTHSAFLDWAIASPREGSSLDRLYCGLRWSAKTIRSRWRIISGDAAVQDTEMIRTRRQSEVSRIGRAQTAGLERIGAAPKASIPSTGSLESQMAAFKHHRDDMIQTFPSVRARASTLSRQDVARPSDTLGRFDFTHPNSAMVLSPHLKFVLDFDWGRTELGPMAHWHPNLRRMVNFLMSDPRPAAMYWGEKRTMLYNEPYVQVTGQRHPRMMGKPFVDAWEEVAADFIPLFDKAIETGSSYVVDHARFYIERHGYLEETYYCISIIPFNISDGSVGFYNPIFDTTRQVIADRRMAFLLQLGQHIASSREPKFFWQQLLLGLDANEFDLPFSIVYSSGWDVMETLSESSGQSQNARNWVLEGMIRVPPDSCVIPQRLIDESSVEEFLANFAELIRSDQPTLLRAENGTLPDFVSKIPVLDDQRCESAIFMPIRSTGDNVLGFMIVGINPKKRYDNDYKIFIELLSRQLATSMASAVLFEEELRRGRMMAEQANQDKNLLSRKLELQRHEALEIEHRFRRMADLAPVGMFHVDPQGNLVYANNDYYKMTGHPRDVIYPMSWYNVIAEVDRPLMDKEWAKLLSGLAVSFELRLKQQFLPERNITNGETTEGSRWIIASAYPEVNEDGSVSGILGTLTDISIQKWNEGFQTRKLLEAVELKRQQENFIDMTSHEMRNPLSAIVQCADWIGTSLAEYGGNSKNLLVPREIADGYIDAAQTIVLCAQHQKRIIDDILTLSKLDSDLLLITPIAVRPIQVIKSALKIFESELYKSDMELRFSVDPSYTDLKVDWVKLDPSRLLQVLINLTTNAIKFTQTESKRKITISVGASTDHPVVRNGIEYLPRCTSRRDMSLGGDWGTGEMVYLYVEVEDTGRGLEDEERNVLFKRFQQASPRTHVQYGGSGLGLFISRELTELQGGQIGVSSKAGVGSTFAFYVRARRCQAPEDIDSSTFQIDNLHPRSQALARIRDGKDVLAPGKVPPAFAVPKHVLIVEDNIVNQKVLSKQLKSAGCIVSVANHGEEALAFLATSRFWKGHEQDGKELTIVLMDLEMPVMDGLTCVKRIRELQKEGTIVRHVPVIAVTANARSEQIAVAKESGMDTVVTKPFRIPELMPEIERQVRNSTERPKEPPC